MGGVKDCELSCGIEWRCCWLLNILFQDVVLGSPESWVLIEGFFYPWCSMSMSMSCCRGSSLILEIHVSIPFIFFFLERGIKCRPPPWMFREAVLDS